MFKKYLSLLLCLTIILSGVSFSVYASRKADDPGLEIGNSEEGIPDANLYEALCDYAEVETLHENDLSQMTELNLQDKKIASLQGLELLHFESLETLDLSHNALAEIDAHAFDQLGNLTALDLSANEFTSFEGIP